jgi:hypothetical protein
MKTPEQIHKEVLRKEFGDATYDLTWRLVTILGVQTVIILGAVYFLLSDLKADLREVRAKVTQKQP